MKKSEDFCNASRCKQPIEIYYKGVGYCMKHYGEIQEKEKQEFLEKRRGE